MGVSKDEFTFIRVALVLDGFGCFFNRDFP